MEIHKPKPIHGWRDFLKEFAIIVLGVSVALGAEQAVEWLHWQHRVADAVEAIDLELRDDDGPGAFTRAAGVQCFEQQLDRIQKAVEGGRPRAQIVDLVRHYAPPGGVFDRNAWDAFMASDVASHVAPDRIIKWGYVYSLVAAMNDRGEKERDNLIALRPVHEQGDRLSPGDAENMLAAVANERAINRRFGNGGGAFLGYMQEAGITLSESQKNR
ncbi:MAG: hypothetical protein JO256_02145, partial [Alphaproteobacteria bacterium]|nr:hypothetical protein [Alphaproteobacteria bacterium]